MYVIRYGTKLENRYIIFITIILYNCTIVQQRVGALILHARYAVFYSVVGPMMAGRSREEITDCTQNV